MEKLSLSGRLNLKGHALKQVRALLIEVAMFCVAQRGVR